MVPRACIRIVERGAQDDSFAYWRGKSPEERLAAVEFLREQYYALSGYKTLPRLARVVSLSLKRKGQG